MQAKKPQPTLFLVLSTDCVVATALDAAAAMQRAIAACHAEAADPRTDMTEDDLVRELGGLRLLAVTAPGGDIRAFLPALRLVFGEVVSPELDKTALSTLPRAA